MDDELHPGTHGTLPILVPPDPHFGGLVGGELHVSILLRHLLLRSISASDLRELSSRPSGWQESLPLKATSSSHRSMHVIENLECLPREDDATPWKESETHYSSGGNGRSKKFGGADRYATLC